MDIILLIYNFLLVILFCLPLSLSLIAYIKTKRPAFLSICILFVFYIADNLIIYMTEIIDWFSDAYDLSFMTVPSFKTLIYAVTFVCLLNIIEQLLQKKIPVYIYVFMMLVLALLLFIPLLPNSAMKVWCYYFPCQVFSFVIGIYTSNVMKKEPDKYHSPFYKSLKKIAICTAIFSVLIVIEDTIVIFNFDIYTDLLVKINNRSLTEDILSIIYAIFAINKMMPLFKVAEPEKKESTLKTNKSETQDLPVLNAENADTKEDYSKFFLFCLEYQLTTREQEILKVLLENKNNTEIGELLFISQGTVKAHIHNIYSKLDIKKRHQLIEKYNSFQPDKENN